MRRVLVLVAVMVGCANPGEPSVTLDLADPAMRQMYPLSGVEWSATHYSEWWANMEECSGLTGNLADLRWFTFNDESVTWFWSPSGRPAGGTYLHGERAIILVPVKITNQHSVEHEMLHALLGVPGHPPVFRQCEV